MNKLLNTKLFVRRDLSIKFPIPNDMVDRVEIIENNIDCRKCNNQTAAGVVWYDNYICNDCYDDFRKYCDDVIQLFKENYGPAA